MKYLKLLAMALMLIFAVAPQSSSAHSPKLVDELSKISVRFADLDKYKQYENQVLPDGVKTILFSITSKGQNAWELT